MPRLSEPATTARPRSYIFVTGEGFSPSMKGLAKVNAHAMRGLSAAPRQEATTAALTVAEVRVL